MSKEDMLEENEEEEVEDSEDESDEDDSDDDSKEDSKPASAEVGDMTEEQFNDLAKGIVEKPTIKATGESKYPNRVQVSDEDIAKVCRYIATKFNLDSQHKGLRKLIKVALANEEVKEELLQN